MLQRHNCMVALLAEKQWRMYNSWSPFTMSQNPNLYLKLPFLGKGRLPLHYSRIGRDITNLSVVMRYGTISPSLTLCCWIHEKSIAKGFLQQPWDCWVALKIFSPLLNLRMPHWPICPLHHTGFLSI